MTILVYYILSWHIGLNDYIGILTISKDLLFYISIKSPICFVVTGWCFSSAPCVSYWLRNQPFRFQFDAIIALEEQPFSHAAMQVSVAFDVDR